MVCRASVLIQPTNLWRAWCTRGQLVMRQLKPRHNLRDLMRPAISSSFYSACLNSFSLPLLQSFFLIRWDFIRPPLSVTAIGCEISEGKACGNHSISCAHLTQHLYRRAGGFWKGEKSFTKSISEAGLTQTDSGNISYNVQRLLFASSLFCACFLRAKQLLDCTGSLRDRITTFRYHIWKGASICMNPWRGKNVRCNNLLA